MKVKIATFGREEVITKIKQLTEAQQDIEIIPFTYNRESETVELIEKAFMCDIYLFTEAISYLYVRKKVQKKRLPAVQIAFDEQMLLTSFYQLQQLKNQKLNRLSIDMVDKKYVESVLQDINSEDQAVFTYDYGIQSEIDIDKIVSFHHNLWKEGKIDYVLTSVKTVEEYLKELNVPTSMMHIPSINIERAIDQGKKSIKLNLSKSAQVVTGYIQIKNPKTIIEQYGEEGLQKKMEKLHHVLTTFSKKTDASVFPISDHQFVIFGTIAVINHLTNHYRDFPLLREIKSEVKSSVDIGYGLGLTAKQSEVNAKIALDTCAKTEDSKCYIVNERQETIGPIGIKKEFDASKLYHALIHNARLNNELSYNFIEFIRTRNNEPFSSNDIANYYNVTKRSAERTVNKLLSGEVIRVSGEERPYQKGRPRKLFTLNQ
ncbi:hypothetical protein [Oceanobacillus bengalensis]|uniref:Transcriptional regulator n=1 Tax=Oceanobacillus bengalensis TaxID=1435466 RepID=A0A494Z076_9BACI|nr:hypothetical protein [Oceanobacillus bengalensis]RKQ15846.1 hypothetical protein D8M05_08785 [Oceanobacillus bengalensis]